MFFPIGDTIITDSEDIFSKEVYTFFSLENLSTSFIFKLCPQTETPISKEVLSVDSDADIVFLDKDGNTYNFKNKDYTLSTPGGGAVVAFGMNLLGVELTLIGNCSVFKDKTMTAI